MLEIPCPTVTPGTPIWRSNVVNVLEGSAAKDCNNSMKPDKPLVQSSLSLAAALACASAFVAVVGVVTRNEAGVVVDVVVVVAVVDGV